MNQDNSSMDMDQEVAKKLFNQGAVLFITGVPKGTEFGIDLCSYVIGDNFRGVKMIPPGPHYVWCAATGPYGDIAPRVGFSYFFQEQELMVREWDANNEELRERQINEPELEIKRLRDNLKMLDAFLAPYDFRYCGDWRKLTDTITKQCVHKCRPALGTIRTNMELLSCSDEERPRGPLAEAHPSMTSKLVNDENDLLPQLKPVEGTAPRFSHIPERIPKHSTPSEVSKHSLDCIHACNELLKNFNPPQDLIQEIQMSFVFFLVGYSVESLAFWRKVLSLLSHSEEAISKYRLLFMKYSEVLVYQLPLLPEELMEPTERNTVYRDIRLLLVNLNLGGLHKSAEFLAKKLEKSMNWIFEGLLDEDPEDMPVVVETNE